MKDITNCLKILAGRPEPTGKRIPGRPKLRWEEHIRTDFKVIVINLRNRIDSVQDRDYWGALVIVAFKLRVYKQWN